MEELIKDVYAAFGLAYYHSEVVYRGLCTIYALMIFNSPEDITTPRIEEKLSLAYSLTLGQLLQDIEILLPSNLFQQCKSVLEKRNFLAHRFWFERNSMMFSLEGLLGIQKELREMLELFSNLNDELSDFIQPTVQNLGITKELLEKTATQIVDGTVEKPLMSQRRPKKSERLTKVWDVKVSEALISQIFETDDGCFWQLCDAGLGWTQLTKSDSNWVINEMIQIHLPATINPRPPITGPWNYKFTLAKGATLAVSRGQKERKYKMKIEQVGKS